MVEREGQRGEQREKERKREGKIERKKERGGQRDRDKEKEREKGLVFELILHEKKKRRKIERGQGGRWGREKGRW